MTPTNRSFLTGATFALAMPCFVIGAALLIWSALEYLERWQVGIILIGLAIAGFAISEWLERPEKKQ